MRVSYLTILLLVLLQGCSRGGGPPETLPPPPPQVETEDPIVIIDPEPEPEPPRRVEVSWSANAEEEQVIEYTVYRDDEPHVVVLAPETWTPDRLGVSFEEPTENHCYAVTATNSAGTSDLSNEACL